MIIALRCWIVVALLGCNGLLESDVRVSRTPQEEQIEDSGERPGKYVPLNDDDSDQDGTPDFADGYNLDGIAGNGDDESMADRFIPVVVELNSPVELTKAHLTFSV